MDLNYINKICSGEITKSELFGWLYREDLSSFIAKTFTTVDNGNKYLHNWHIDCIAEYLKECYNGNIKRLIINIPPRSLKSISVSVAFPAWVLGKNPSERIVVASYSELLSLKHSTDCRLVVSSKWFCDAFSEFRLSATQNEKQKFATTKNGYRFATSVGGTLTGEGGNILIVDDPHNPQQVMSEKHRDKTIEWFKNTFSSRLNDKKKGVIIVVMQRLHENDLSGYLLNKTDGWTHLNLPAIADREQFISVGGFTRHRKKGELLHSAREGAEEINRARAELGSFAFSAQYQQNPVIQVGGMIRAEWFGRFDTDKYACQYSNVTTHPLRGTLNQNNLCHSEFNSESKDLINNVTPYSLRGTNKNQAQTSTPQQVRGDTVGYGYDGNYKCEKSKTINFKSITLSFDTAIKAGAKNDPTVCTIWGELENSYFLLEVYRDWLEYPELKKQSIELIKRWKADTVLIEDKASGQSLIQDLKKELRTPIIPIKVTKDKVTRLASVSSLIEAGRVFLPREASWLADFEQEVYLFPNCEHDDQVDSMSQFLHWIKTKPEEVARDRKWRVRGL